MPLFFLLACAASVDDATLEGVWTVDALEFDSFDVEELVGEGWGGELEVRTTGFGTLSLSGADDSATFTLDASEDEGGWHLGGTNDGLLILDLACTVDGERADCVDGGAIDWATEDSDTHVTLLSVSRD